MSETVERIVLRAEGISKRFGITQALDNVSVAFRAGEVHALMGENGAGKSTLGKTIAGLHKQDSGVVTIHDAGGATRELKPGSIDDAFEAGVRIVHQELAQCPNLTVAENLCLHDIPTRAGLVDRRAMAERAARLVHKLDPAINVETPLGLLSPGRRQICQIAASLEDRAGASHAPRLIVFDEPTSSLSVAEADRLLEITRHLAKDGLTIVYVSHRMGEIFQVCDRVTVLRDGKFIATSNLRDIDEPSLIEQMIGRRIEATTRRAPSTSAPAIAAPNAGSIHDAGEAAALRQLIGGEPHKAGKPMLEVKNLSSPGKLRDVSLTVRAGEILGIGGLVGAGRSETLDAIFGLDPKASGQIMVDAAPVNLSSPRGPIAASIGYVPEDRRLQGLFFQLGIDENILVPFMHRIAGSLGLRRARREKELVTEKVGRFQVKAASLASLPGELSGGNQQKLLIARWMGKDTKVLLLDEPTRGIDVGTKSEVYKLVRAAADAGAAVLLVSSEMPELLALSDRIVVMCNGRLSGELTGDDMTQTNILKLATADEAVRRGA